MVDFKTKVFIGKSLSIHGTKYDYSLVRYINNTTKVSIICKKHGVFEQTPHNHLCGNGCPSCGRERTRQKKLGSVLDFIEKAKRRHGERFNYSKIEYKGVDNPVIILCKKHGPFHQTPYSHLNSKICCPECLHEDQKRIKLNFGVNDLKRQGKTRAYRIWCCMISRCYSNGGAGTYKECYVCEDWKSFASFKEWFDKEYIEGFCLDKDILIKGNKEYSPNKCCFVPNEINAIFKKYHKDNGLPIGVRKVGKKYNARYRNKSLFSSYSLNEAFEAFKNAKEKHIKDIAQKYYSLGLLKPNVFSAMMLYTVEFND